VAWADSAVKQFQEKAKSGDSVVFVVNEGDRHQINTNVYILSVELILDLVGARNIRRFTVRLQKAT